MNEYIVAIAGEPPEWGEPIVRCKNCKQMRDWTENELDESYDKSELADGWCMFFRIGTYGDFFCAWGKNDATRNVQ